MTKDTEYDEKTVTEKNIKFMNIKDGYPCNQISPIYGNQKIFQGIAKCQKYVIINLIEFFS